MTQHYFDAKLADGESVSIVVGWDRPLQQFFLVIETDNRESKHSDCEGIVYSNLYDNEARTDDWEYFSKVLNERGITEPEGLCQALQHDRECNAGNLVKEWGEPAQETV